MRNSELNGNENEKKEREKNKMFTKKQQKTGIIKNIYIYICTHIVKFSSRTRCRPCDCGFIYDCVNRFYDTCKSFISSAHTRIQCSVSEKFPHLGHTTLALTPGSQRGDLGLSQEHKAEVSSQTRVLLFFSRVCSKMIHCSFVRNWCYIFFAPLYDLQ